MKGLAIQLGWYAVGTLVTALSSLAVFVVYARALAPDQLGVLVVTHAVVTVLRIVGTGGAPLGMFRYVAGTAEDRGGRSAPALIMATLIFVIVASSALGAVAAAFAWPVLGGLPGHDARALMGLAALTAVASGPREIIELVLRGETRALAWCVYVSVTSVVLTICASYAVLVVDPTAESILEVQLAGLAITGGFGLLLIRRSLALDPSGLRELRTVLRIGLPNSVSAFLDWGLHYVDRFILLAFVTASEVGIYSFGSRVAMFVQQLGGAAAQAGWDPYSYREHGAADGAQRLGRSATVLLVAVLAQAVLMGAAAGPFVVLTGGQAEYVAGAAFVFPVGIAYWLGMVRYFFVTPLAIRFRPELGIIALGAAAIVNVALDLLLIPSFGISGATAAVLLSSLVGAAVAFALGHRWRAIAFEPAKLAIALAVATLAYIAANGVVTPFGVVTLLARPAAAAIVFGAALVGLRVLPSPVDLVRRRMLVS